MSRILIIALAFTLFGGFLLAAVIATEASPVGSGMQFETTGVSY
jgi:hypothetical protein